MLSIEVVSRSSCGTSIDDNTIGSVSIGSIGRCVVRWQRRTPDTPTAADDMSRGDDGIVPDESPQDGDRTGRHRGCLGNPQLRRPWQANGWRQGLIHSAVAIAAHSTMARSRGNPHEPPRRRREFLAHARHHVESQARGSARAPSSLPRPHRLRDRARVRSLLLPQSLFQPQPRVPDPPTKRGARNIAARQRFRPA